MRHKPSPTVAATASANTPPARLVHASNANAVPALPHAGAGRPSQVSESTNSSMPSPYDRLITPYSKVTKYPATSAIRVQIRERRTEEDHCVDRAEHQPFQQLHRAWITGDPRNGEEHEVPERGVALVAEVREHVTDGGARPGDVPCLQLVEPHRVGCDAHRTDDRHRHEREHSQAAIRWPA